MTREPNFGPSGQVCRGCDIEKPLTDFARRTENRSGHKYTCRVCETSYQKAYRSANRQKLEDKRKARYSVQQIRAFDLKYKYGVTLDWYEFKLVEQNYVCAVCQKPPLEGTNLAVDHDHSCCSGQRSCGACVRALLCNKCNPGLGYFQDDEELLLAAVDYLRSFK